MNRSTTIQSSPPPRPSAASVTAPGANRWVVLLVFVGLCLGTIIYFAGGRTIVSLELILVDGGLSLLWAIGAAGLGQLILTRWMKEVHPAWQLASSTAAGHGLLSLVLLGLGLAGWLNQLVVLLLLIAGLLAGAWGLANGWQRRKRSGQPLSVMQPSTDAWGWAWIAPAIGLGMMLVAATVIPGLLWLPDPHPYDVMSYHLQVPREWYELGRIAPLHHNVFSFFPMSVEVHFLALMHLLGGPWKGMYACQFFNAWLSVALVVGIYGAGRTLNAGTTRGLALIAAVLTALMPWTIKLGSVAYTETALMLMSAMSLAWLLRAMQQQSLSAGVIAGLFGGLACAVKYPAVPMLVLTAAAAALIAGLLTRALPRRLIGLVAVYCATALIAFSPWLVRNMAWSGNPVFPLAMKMAGQGHFTDTQVQRFEQAHGAPAQYRQPLNRAGLVFRAFLFDGDFGYLLIPLTIAAALATIKSRAAIFFVVMLAGMLLVWLGFTHLISRFMVLAIPLGAIILVSLPLNRWWTGAMIILLPIALAISIMQLHDTLLGQTTLAEGQAIGADDLSPAFVDQRRADQSLALIGDARAFIYHVPMDRLIYRTVFDLLPPRGAWFTAWTGEKSADLLLINAAEVKRLHATYLDVPALPADIPPDAFKLIPDPRR